MVRTLALVAAAAAGVLVTSASPSYARCVQTGCSWTVVIRTCKGPLGVSVPCPVKKKVCSGERYCSSSSH